MGVEQITEGRPSVERGQIYEDQRTDDLFEVVYIDDNVYVCQNTDESHRFGKRKQFDTNVSEGRYKHQPDEPQFAETERADDGDDEIAFEELENLGEAGAGNLRQAGIETKEDVRRASDEEILDVPWVGEGGLESIRDAV